MTNIYTFASHIHVNSFETVDLTFHNMESVVYCFK